VYTVQNAIHPLRSISGPKMGHYEGMEMNRYVGFEVLTAVVMKYSILWDIILCSSLKVSLHFGGTCRLHLQVQKISQARNKDESRWQTEHVPLKHRLTLNGLRGVISHKTELFNRYIYISLRIVHKNFYWTNNEIFLYKRIQEDYLIPKFTLVHTNHFITHNVKNSIYEP
jgi:hypothetical protein